MGKKLLKKGQVPLKSHTELYDKITKIEHEVLSRIQKLKSIPKSDLCSHLTKQNSKVELYNPEHNYYDLYWKQCMVNDVGIKHIQTLDQEINDMKRKLNKIENLFYRRKEELTSFNIKMNSYGLQESNVECETCHKMFRDTETYLLHKKIKHEENSGSEVKKEEEMNSDRRGLEDIYDSGLSG